MTEEVAKEEFLRSRLTCHEVQCRLLIMAGSAGNVAPGARLLIPEMPWDGWEKVSRELNRNNPEADELLWFAATSLAPATMTWIEVYHQPELFTA